jgi:hypothetical protein
MPKWVLNPSQCDKEFQFFAHELESLVERLHESPSLGDRTRLLRRMKVLIVEIDMLILSTLKRDRQDAPNSSSPG